MSGKDRSLAALDSSYAAPTQLLQGVVSFESDFVQRPVVLIRQHIQVSVRALANIPDSRLELTQQTLFVDDLVALQLQADQFPGTSAPMNTLRRQALKRSWS